MQRDWGAAGWCDLETTRCQLAKHVIEGMPMGILGVLLNTGNGDDGGPLHSSFFELFLFCFVYC